MTKFLKYIIPALLVGLGLPLLIHGASSPVTPQYGGGTATSTKFTNGQLIYQNANGYAGATLIQGSNIIINTSTPGQITLSATGGSSVSTSSVQSIMLPLIANGTVAGVNATSSVTSFLVQGTDGLNPFAVSSSTGTNLLTVTQAGRLGIGSANPGQLLSVGNDNFTVDSNGNINGNNFIVGNEIDGTSGNQLTLSAQNFFIAQTMAAIPGGLFNSSGNSYGLSIRPSIHQSGSASYTALNVAPTQSTLGSGANYLMEVKIGSGTDNLSVTNTNKIGINTSTPAYSLDVYGTGTTSPFNVSSSSNVSLFQVTANGNVNVATLTASSLVMSDANKNLQSVLLGTNLSFSGNTLNATGGGSGNSAWTIGNGLIYNATSTDLVGIGTITPTTTLFIQGKSAVNPFAIASSTGTQLLTVTQAGNVEIGNGSTTPTSPLVITASTTTKPALSFVDLNGSTTLEVRTPPIAAFSTYIGTGAGASADLTKLNVTALGYGALQSNVQSYNGAFGTYALHSNTSGEFNNAFGEFALQAATSSSWNTAMGEAALQVLTDGHTNTAFGNDSQYSNLHGSWNTTVGAYSLNSLITGNNNTAVGEEVGYTLATSTDNTLYGAYADYLGTNNSGNTFIGKNAGHDDTTGSSNVALGLGAGSGITTGSGNIMLGYGAGLNSTTSSNSFYLNNIAESSLANDKDFSLLYGSFSGSGATLGGQQLTVNASTTTLNSVVSITGNVGIGTTTPGSKLVLQGTAGSAIPLMTIASSSGVNLLTVSDIPTTVAGLLLNVASSTSGTTMAGVDGYGRLQVYGLVYGSGSTPTVATSTGAGSAGTASITGSNTDFQLTVNALTSPSTSATIATVTMANNVAAPNKLICTFSPSNGNAAALSGTTQVIAGSGTTTFTLTSGSAALTTGTTYTWFVRCGGY